MRSFIDFDYVNMAIDPAVLVLRDVLPDVRSIPPGSRRSSAVTPLYQGVVLERSLVVGDVHWTLLLNAAYLAVMGSSACGSRAAASAASSSRERPSQANLRGRVP